MICPKCGCPLLDGVDVCFICSDAGEQKQSKPQNKPAEKRTLHPAVCVLLWFVSAVLSVALLFALMLTGVAVAESTGQVDAATAIALILVILGDAVLIGLLWLTNRVRLGVTLRWVGVPMTVAGVFLRAMPDAEMSSLYGFFYTMLGLGVAMYIAGAVIDVAKNRKN